MAVNNDMQNRKVARNRNAKDNKDMQQNTKIAATGLFSEGTIEEFQKLSREQLIEQLNEQLNAQSKQGLQELEKEQLIEIIIKYSGVVSILTGDDQSGADKYKKEDLNTEDLYKDALIFKDGKIYKNAIEISSLPMASMTDEDIINMLTGTDGKELFKEETDKKAKTYYIHEKVSKDLDSSAKKMGLNVSEMLDIFIDDLFINDNVVEQIKSFVEDEESKPTPKPKVIIENGKKKIEKVDEGKSKNRNLTLSIANIERIDDLTEKLGRSKAQTANYLFKYILSNV